MYYLGVDLGGTNIKAALVSENGEIVKEAAAPTNLPRTAQEVCDDIAALCLQLSAGEPVAGIGVGCPGTVCDGVVLYSNNLAISTGTILLWRITCKPKPGCLSASATTPMWLPSAKHWRAAPKGRRVR